MPDLPLDRLPPRPREVCRLMALGYSTHRIGRALGLSSSTVEVHRARLYELTGLDCVADVTRYAIRRGLVTAYEGTAESAPAPPWSAVC